MSEVEEHKVLIHTDPFHVEVKKEVNLIESESRSCIGISENNHQGSHITSVPVKACKNLLVWQNY